jgi:hypothetical protein
MAKQLSDEDRRAVDLLLDRPDGTMKDIPPPSGPISAARVQSVEKILQLIQQMPAHEPPADLAERTLKRVDQALAALGAPQVQNPAHRDTRPLA